MQDQTQQPNMSADKSAAALAFATMLSEQQMPQVAPEQPQETPQAPQEAAPETLETAPEPEEAPEVEEVATPQEQAPIEPNKQEEQMTNLTKDFDEFKGKIEGIIETKFNDLTKTLHDALKD